MSGLRTVPSLGDLLRNRARLAPSNTAITSQQRSSSYLDLIEHSLRVANALCAAGVSAGDRIAILSKNSDRYLEVLFGAAIGGVVTVPINWRLAADEIVYILGDSQTRVLFIEAELLRARPELANCTVHASSVVFLDDASGPSYREWRDRHSSNDPQRPVCAKDVVLQLYTAGTTGRPKGALLTHHGLNCVRVSQPECSRWSQWTQDDICLISMPLFHIGGIGTALAALYHGARMIIAREFVADTVFDHIERDRISRLFLVPSALRILLAHPRARTTDYSSLRYILYGSSPIAEELLREAMQIFGCGFVQVYGMTETSGTVVALTPEDHAPESAARMRCAGKPLRGVELLVLDARGRPLWPRAIGEIAIRSEANMLRYWKLPQETAACFTPCGFLRTGDLGFLDSDGYLTIRGRLKDMIITGGENVYAAEVESVLVAYPGVAEVAVIGVPDERWGEAVKAVIVPAHGAMLDPAEICAWARRRIAGYKVPKSIDLKEQLPKNAAGKVLRRVLREPYWQQRER